MSAREQAQAVIHETFDNWWELDDPLAYKVEQWILRDLNAAGLIVVRAEDVKLAVLWKQAAEMDMGWSADDLATWDRLKSALADQSGGDHE